MEFHQIENKINLYRKEIDNTKAENSKLEGTKEALIENLSASFNISSIEEIKLLLEELTKKKNELNMKINQQLQELEKEYPFE